MIVIITAVVLALVLLWEPDRTLCQSHKGEYSYQLAHSQYFDEAKERFVNRRGGLLCKMFWRNFGPGFLLERFKLQKELYPDGPMPQHTPDLDRFLSDDEKLKIIWLGHSTLLLRLGDRTILIDPVLTDSASPLDCLIKRFQKPALSLDQLPKIDAVVISHDHYDHFDRQTLMYFSDEKTIFLTPLGVGSHLRSWGISEGQIFELDWWETLTLFGIEFTATPAQHYSGRKLIDSNATLWASWVIKGNGNSLYYSGDSGYDIHFKEIGQRLGPFDMAFIETGQYNERWEEIHMLPEQAAQAYFDLKAKRYFPVHWAMFVLARHSWFDPIIDIQALADAQGINLIAPLLGEIVTLDEDIYSLNHWEAFLNEG